MSKLLLARVLLGCLLLAAGFPKAAHPEQFASQVAAYQLVPSRLVTLVALALPRMEILAGLGLLTNLLPASSALVATGLFLSFALATASALARGLGIECGCFPVELSLHWLHPLVNLGLAAVAARVCQAGLSASRSNACKHRDH